MQPPRPPAWAGNRCGALRWIGGNGVLHLTQPGELVATGFGDTTVGAQWCYLRNGLLGAVGYKVSPSLVLDGGLDVGLSHGAQRVSFFAGLTVGVGRFRRSFAAPIFLTRAWEGAHLGPLYYVVMFAFYFCNYFVITFFNAAIVGSAVIRLSGGEPTFGDAIRTATSRLPQILAWAALAATVGLILRVIEQRSKRVGQFVAGLMGRPGPWPRSSWFRCWSWSRRGPSTP